MDVKKSNKEKFIEKARIVHNGENLDYSKVVYINNRTPVEIIDHDLDDTGNEYGEYWQEPCVHLKGCGHPKKGIKKQAESFMSFGVSDKFTKIDGYRYVAVSKNGTFHTYDYLNKAGKLTDYVENTLGIKLPSSYVRRNQFKKTGNYWFEEYFDIIQEKEPETKKCPYCDWETVDVNNNSGAFEVHLKECHSIDKITYLKEHPEDREYFSLANKTLDRQLEDDESKFVRCEICGKKLARIDWRHLNSHGITKYEYMIKYGHNTISNSFYNRLIDMSKHMNEVCCDNERFTSKSESNIKEYIESLGIECAKNRNILHGQELDIFIPSHNLAIEYDGLKWHTERFGKKDKNYHLNKTELCKKEGVNLIHIFEDELVNNADIVYSKIRHILKKDTSLQKIPGRKCIIKEINTTEASKFLDKYHIQGFVSSSIYLGAFYDNKLIAVMTFKKEDRKCLKWDLNRFASDYNYCLQGVGGKLFSYFIKNYNPEEVKSFLDRRWCFSETENIYTKLGFKFEKYTKPEYRYYNEKVNKYCRFHKFGFRKKILSKKYGFDLTMTENEMIDYLGYDKIWDCGLIKYIWEK